LAWLVECRGTVIWAIFLLEFGLRLALAPDRLRFLRTNWLSVIALAAPAFRLVRGFRLLRFARAARGLREERRLSPKDLLDDGPSGARPDEQSPRQTDEANFAKQLAETLYKMNQAGAFKALVLVADPQTLGQFRDAMHKTMEASLVLTLDKDFTNHSVRDIEQALT